MNRLNKTLFTFIMLSTFGLKAVAAVGPYDTQVFAYADGWRDTTAETGEDTSHHDWQLIDGYVNINNSTFSPFEMPKSRHSSSFDMAVWLTTTNSAVVIPQLVNGAGSISFWINNLDTGQNDFSIQYSPTGGAPWTTVTNMQYNGEDWVSRTVQIDVYNSIYMRILKTGDSGGNANGQLLGLDDITIIRPMAYVDISEVQADPETPIISTEADLTCHIEPWGNVSATAVTSFWKIVGSAGDWNTIAMEPNGPPASNNWITTSPIPPQAPSDTFIEYWIHTEFLGQDAASPVNYPLDAPSNTVSLLYRKPVYLSNYTNVYLTGTFDTNLTLAADNIWQGVISLTTNIINAPFNFEGTNISGIVTWGETNQPHLTMPVFGNLETNIQNIIIGGTNTGHIFFTFDESINDYSAQLCAYVNFNNWTGAETFGTYTNIEEWIISDCRMTTNSAEDQAHVLSGFSCIMNSNSGPQYIISPLMSNGIGEIAFSYRNWETNGAIAIDLDVQVSTNPTGPWITVDTIDTIRNADYLNFSHVRSDRDNHYVRILRSTNTSAKLCIDNLLIADPGPGITFDTLTITPPSPNILDTPDISITATPWGNATNSQCTLWYRYNTNFPFTSIPMTESGLTFTSSNSIPRMPLGDIQYYIECSFQGMSSVERVTAYHPEIRETSPFTYTVGEWSSTTQVFAYADGWRDTTTETGEDVSHHGWQLIDGYVNMNNSTFNPFEMPKSRHSSSFDMAVWLTTTNSALITEQYTNGVGLFSFQANNVDLGVNYFSIQYSDSNSGPWTNIVDSSYNGETWNELSFEVNITSSIYIRILKTTDSGGGDHGQLLGIDDIAVGLTPTMVAITVPLTHPGYPASNDTVNISCYIDPLNTQFRAFNIGARLYYRTGESGPFTNSILMSKISTNYFITTELIPAFPTETTVEYYIESTFDGYAPNVKYKYSPTYLSTGVALGTNTHYFTPPINNHLNYTTRYYKSEYQVLQLTGLNTPLNLELQDDNTWQGIFSFPEPVTNPAIILSGLSHYTGTNYASTADTWADIYQTRTQIPLYNLMQPGETNALTMVGEQQGQYMFRFDEKNMSYILLRCAFQDFDLLDADSMEFSESWSSDEDTIITTNNFDDWELSSYDSWPIENFRSWDLSTNYAAGVSTGGVGWAFGQCMIIPQLNGDQACMMRDDHSTDPYIRPIRHTWTDGIDTFDFEYRCIDTNFYPTLYWPATNMTHSRITATISGTDLPVNKSGAAFGDCYISLISQYANKNSYYELRVQQTDLNTHQLCLYKKSGTSFTLLATLKNDYSGNISNTKTLTLITSPCGDGKTIIGIEATGMDDGSQKNPGDDYRQFFDEFGLTTPGAVGINTFDTGIIVDNVKIGSTPLNHFQSWLNENWANTVTNSGWVAKFGWMDDDHIRLLDPTPSNDGAFIRSPILPHGVSQIRFHYQGTDALRPFKFHVQQSTTGSANDIDWTTIETVDVPSATDNDVWATYDKHTNISTANVYIRIRIATDSVYEGWFDKIRIDPCLSDTNLVYTEDFEDNEAQNWTDLGSTWWTATNGTYTRPGYTSDPLSFELQTTTLDNQLDLDSDNVWDTHYTFTDCTQSTYITVSPPTNAIKESGATKTEALSFVRLKHTGGAGHIIIDNAQFHSWHGKTTIHSNNWVAKDAWITTENAKTGTCVELTASRAYVDDYNNGNQYIRSAELTNGVGVIKFHYRALNSSPTSFELQYTHDTNTPTWSVLRTYTNVFPVWTTNREEVALNTNVSTYIQIIHTSTNSNAGILIDEIEAPGSSERGEYNWVVYNGLVTARQTDKLWTSGRNPYEKTAYLNYGPGEYPDTPKVLDKYGSHIQSPKRNRGIGEISFWYRSWNISPTNPPTLRIKAATSYILPESNWVEIAAITNISNAEYKYFSLAYYDITNRFLRFYADVGTSEDARICIDDILIIEPLGADMVIQNIRTVPAIPLTDEPVHIQVDLAQYLLDVNITNLQLRYLIGTNTWGTWDPGNIINMTQITNNTAAGTYTWETDEQIPGQGIDTTVQYYVYSEFSGVFADKGGSPKIYKEFINPTHYAPINLNTEIGGTNNIPYYIVFSCLPGTVWFNELNLADTEDFNNEYIELCGPAGTDISGWKINMRGENGGDHTTYTIPPSTTIPDDDNGYGYWVLGDSGVSQKDMTLNVIYYNDGWDPDQHIPFWGGMALYRSMGAAEHKIHYNTDYGSSYFSDNNYEFLNADDAFWLDEDGSMQWQGTGSNYTDFAWTLLLDSNTPGVANDDQFFSDTILITITDFQILSTTIQISYTQTSGNNPNLWYTTNLMQTNSWMIQTNYTGPTESNGIYTLTIDLPTNNPVYFHKLITTQ
ncbi:MAG: hypothetical protein KAH23_01895 [Kiritimatiellae bacterium]|nr:hypothetical protein [Kiritimatiellia bacterium]